MQPLRRICELGRGAHGVCYRAVDGSGKEVCLKELCVEAAAAAAELAVLSALPPHPHVVAMLGTSISETHLGIQLELMEGSLDRLLQRRALSPPEVWAVLAQAAAGLAHVHAHGLLHRDVKMENVLFREGAAGAPLEVKVADFGVARFVAADASALTCVGTAYNLSPEMIDGLPYGASSDCFAFGCVLFELVAGKKPFFGTNLGAVVTNILRCRPAFPPALPAALAALLRSLLARDAASRPTMAEVLAYPHVAAALTAVQAGRLPEEVGGGGDGGSAPLSSSRSGSFSSPPSSARAPGALDVGGDEDFDEFCGWGSPNPVAGARDAFFAAPAGAAPPPPPLPPPPPAAALPRAPLAPPSSLLSRRSASDVLKARGGEPPLLRKRRSANDVLTRGMEIEFLAAMARARAGLSPNPTPGGGGGGGGGGGAPPPSTAAGAPPSLPLGIAARLRRRAQ